MEQFTGIDDFDDPLDPELRIVENPDQGASDEQIVFEVPEEARPSPNEFELASFSSKDELQQMTIPIEERRTMKSVHIALFKLHHEVHALKEEIKKKKARFHTL